MPLNIIPEPLWNLYSIKACFLYQELEIFLRQNEYCVAVLLELSLLFTSLGLFSGHVNKLLPLFENTIIYMDYHSNLKFIKIIVSIQRNFLIGTITLAAFVCFPSVCLVCPSQFRLWIFLVTDLRAEPSYKWSICINISQFISDTIIIYCDKTFGRIRISQNTCFDLSTAFSVSAWQPDCRPLVCTIAVYGKFPASAAGATSKCNNEKFVLGGGGGG